MEGLMNRLGMVVGLLGLVLCLVAGIGRLGGQYYILGYQLITLMFAGVGMMVASCMFKLYSSSFSK